VFTYVLRRVLYSIPVLLVASVLIFFFVSLAGDPLAELRVQPGISQDTLQNIVERKHLDEPIIVQYGYWLRDAVTNRFGVTFFADRPILPELVRAMGNTLQLVIAAEIFSLLLAITIGVLSARKQYSPFDYAATTFSFFGFSMPIFWFALILQVIFVNLFVATGVRLFYTSGLSSLNPDNFLLDRLQHLVLPVVALSFVYIAEFSRYTRASMLEVINSDYVRTARAKGLRERKVINKHAFRNALIPLTTIATVRFGELFGGAIITETVFSLDGMGLYFIRALGQGDVYQVMAWLMVVATLIIFFNLLADVLYGYLDPRIRYD
jgi:peptide/nickel transport system permease protein